jgi:hypothetical protein
MERVFNQYKELEIIHADYKGILCGYNEEHFILAIKASSPAFGFRKLPKESIIIDEYISNKYKYVYENESELIKQSNEKAIT